MSLSSNDLILGTNGGGPETGAFGSPLVVRSPTNPGLVGNFRTIFSVVEGSSGVASLKPGGKSADTSSVSMLSKRDEREREKSGLEVVVDVGVEDFSSSSFSSGMLNPGGKNALTSSNLIPPNLGTVVVSTVFGVVSGLNNLGG